ncbi:MAG: type III-A CRISPR-associated protein Csm2 [Desulfobacterales bacterium]
MPGYPNHPGRHGGGGQRQGFSGSRGGDQHEARQLPTPNALKYYKGENSKTLDPDLIDTKAAEWAQSFAELKTSQMRRFYDDLKAIERKIMTGKDAQAQAENFKRDWPMVVLFKAKAAYAEKRGVAPRAFTQFIFDHVASIKDLNDFRSFLKVFEAVVAFHKFYSKEK